MRRYEHGRQWGDAIERTLWTCQDKGREQDMARRDRFRNLVWLKTLPDDKAEGRYIAPPGQTMPMKDAIHELTRDLHLWIEMELLDGSFFLRCFPKPGGGGPGRPNICASYKGPSMAALLTSAVLDYTCYLRDPASAELSRLESCRWVA